MTLRSVIAKGMESTLKLQPFLVHCERLHRGFERQGSSRPTECLVSKSSRTFNAVVARLKGGFPSLHGGLQHNCQLGSVTKYGGKSTIWQQHSATLNNFPPLSGKRTILRGLFPETLGRPSEPNPPEESQPSLAEDLNKLKQWLSSNGAFIGSVDISSDSTGGLGLVATRAVKKGERLITLPKHLQLTYDEGSRGEDANLVPLIERIPDQLWAMKLGVKLLSERAKVRGKWWPYILNLPQKFSLPMFWAGSEIAALQYPPVTEQVKMRCRFLQSFSNTDLPEVLSLPLFANGTLPHPFRGQPVDANSLGWAMAAVSSRAFRMHGETKPATLLPLIDMSNHSFEPTCHLQLSAPNSTTLPPGTVEMFALTDLAPGTPLLLNYGPFQNDFLLMDYGFIVENNPHDRVGLRFDVNLLEAAQSALRIVEGGHPEGGDEKIGIIAPWQQAVLTQLRLAGPQGQLLVGIGGPGFVEGRFLAALRTLFARTPADLKGKNMAQLQNPGAEGALGPSNEKQALLTVVTACAVALSKFPSMAKQDEELLQAGGLSQAMEIATRFRLGKKRLLMEAINELGHRVGDIKTASRKRKK